MKRISILFCLLLGLTATFAQQEEIHFVGHNLNDNNYIQLSKIEITNLTQEWTETIFYPDTTLILKVSVGIDDQREHSFGLKQNNPNPFTGTTEVSLEVAQAGKISLEINDILGRKVKSLTTTVTTPGSHAFRIDMASTGTYVLTARQNGKVSSIKMINQGIGNSNNITYVGAAANLSFYCKNGSKGTINKPFFYGDKMEFKGYAEVPGGEVEGEPVWKEEINSGTIALPINPNFEDFVCGISSVVDIDGNIYNTVLLDRQCWMKENLRVSRQPNGNIIPISTEMSFSKPYRYLADNDEERVEELGYLYNWAAVINKRNASDKVPSGVQGICPAGWHVPSNQEYLDMFDYVASVAEYVCEDRLDTFPQPAIAKALASSKSWRAPIRDACSPGLYPEDNNATGFSVVAAGCFYNVHQQTSIGAYMWTASENTESWQNDAFFQYFNFGITFIQTSGGMKDAGYSLRCLRDY